MIVTSLLLDLGKRKACRCHVVCRMPVACCSALDPSVDWDAGLTSPTCCEQEFGHSVPEFVIHRDTVDGWKQISLIGKITLSAEQLRMLAAVASPALRTDKRPLAVATPARHRKLPEAWIRRQIPWSSGLGTTGVNDGSR
jgi:hypothetical protein